MIPYGRQDVSDQDIEAVVRVLRSDFLTQGPLVPQFEEAVAHRVGARHAVAVNSATSALHVACMALGLGPGDLLWTVPNTFVASANCARYCGAAVDFVDIDAVTWNMSVAALERKLQDAERAGRLPKVVVPVHFSGAPTQQQAIWQLAQRYGFAVLEDASHSIGASSNGEPVGSCRWSHVTVFSFHPVKIVTTGEGGMCLTNDAAVGQRMARLRTHGITRDTALMEQVEGPWYYEQIELGYNYRMTDLHAALGLSQLSRIDQFVERRNALALRYHEALSTLPVRRPSVAAGDRSAFHLYVIRLQDRSPAQHRAIFEALRARGIGVNLHYIPVHLQPYYRRLGFRPGDFPEAEAYGHDAITLPLYPGLSERDQDRVVSELRAVLR